MHESQDRCALESQQSKQRESPKLPPTVLKLNVVEPQKLNCCYKWLFGHCHPTPPNKKLLLSSQSPAASNSKAHEEI